MAGSWTLADARGVLRSPTAADDKYSRGVVGFRTGSDAYPGAAVLGVEAAWRAGIGMVRYLGPDRAAQLVLARRPETVTADGRVQAWVIGSGMVPTAPPDADDASPGDSGRVGPTAARSAADTAALRGILSGAQPVIVDAGALDLAVGAHAPRIVTPHAREHARLRELLGLDPASAEDDDGRAAVAAQTAAALGATVVVKGAVTIVAQPDGWATRVTAGTPWLATAGTGDVLAGALGAVVAAAEARREAQGEAHGLGALAATAVWLHGRAATLAAGGLGAAGGPITALDVADALPLAVAEAIAAE
ncbi:ADP/ATP-dependent (S)-NAD(P)H-hydrate dehydratase [Microbacterium pumilum]|uniref:ADP-dependent (S)-NAD(P)H-hydrate dehydratase n=1 Tax=Microbacterium pumilum TaxID=344165 RepID=A0ABN2SEY0_9MICO